MDKPSYQRESKSVVFQGKPITLTHLTPTLTPQQRERRKREIEGQLYEVFRKYAADTTTHKKAQ